MSSTWKKNLVYYISVAIGIAGIVTYNNYQEKQERQKMLQTISASMEKREIEKEETAKKEEEKTEAAASEPVKEEAPAAEPVETVVEPAPETEAPAAEPVPERTAISENIEVDANQKMAFISSPETTFHTLVDSISPDSLTGITIYNSGEFDITGLGLFSNLEYIYFENIDDINMSSLLLNMPKLKSIEIGNASTETDMEKYFRQWGLRSDIDFIYSDNVKNVWVK